MGAEYSNDFFTKGRELYPMATASAHTTSQRKTFKQKRAEEDVAEQVALVSRLQSVALEGIDGDSDDDMLAVEGE